MIRDDPNHPLSRVPLWEIDLSIDEARKKYEARRAKKQKDNNISNAFAVDRLKFAPVDLRNL